jgi:GR25 family glycosyltransferase involved in LPS biosynthesis
MFRMPPIWVIHCRETGRRRKIEGRLARAGLAANYWEGIHGATAGLRTVHLCNDGFAMCPGQVGLVLSHYTLWQVFAFRPENEWMVLEDDARIPPNLAALWSEYYPEVPTAAGIVFAGHCGTSEVNVLKVLSPRISRVRFCFGTHCYVVRRRALEVLLRNNREVRDPIDTQLALRSLPFLETYAFTPSLVSQDSQDGAAKSSMREDYNPELDA